MKKSSKHLNRLNNKDLKVFLDLQVSLFGTASFVDDDPVLIPHQYTKIQDIEISGFWTAMLAWGQRKTIINKANELFDLMDNAPYDFITNHQESDREKFREFKHRTFQYTDTLYFIEFLQHHYRNNESLESAFLYQKSSEEVFNLKESLIHFHNYFFSLEHAPQRTRKHIATPARNSACKRLNMFLRWMVRDNDNNVDFGLWHKIPKSALMVPLDVHVHRVATRLGLLKRKQSDWKSLEEIMSTLRKLDPIDPGKYDYALFGIGVNADFS